MTWIKLDDQVLAHPKFVRAVRAGGSAAVHLWLGMVAYCSQHLTDGIVPEDMFDEVRGPRSDEERQKALGSLLDSGLLDPVPDGYQIHDYLEWAPSKEEVLERRDRDATRKSLRQNGSLMRDVKERDRNCCRYCGQRVDWSNRKGPNGGTYDHVQPVTKGGSNDAENVVVACRKCGERKQKRTLQESGMVLLPVEPTESATGSSYQIPTGSNPVALPERSGSSFQSPDPDPDPVLIPSRPTSEIAGASAPPPPPPPVEREPDVPCPQNLEIPPDVAEQLCARYRVTAADLRRAVDEFASYWTIGAGAGRRKTRAGWMLALRERLRRRGESGELSATPTPKTRQRGDYVAPQADGIQGGWKPPDEVVI